MAENWKTKNRRWHANAGMALAIAMGLIALSCPFIAHKFGGDLRKGLEAIHFGNFLPPDYRWIWIDLQGAGLFFLVFSGWLMHRKSVKVASRKAADDPAVAGSSVTILDLGDGAPARALGALAQGSGLRTFVCTMAEIERLDLADERWLVLTGEVPAKAAVENLRARIAGLKPKSLHPLEIALSPGFSDEDAAALLEAFAVAGAESLKGTTVPGADIEVWNKRVLAVLGARSRSLAKKMQAPASPGTPPTGSADLAVVSAKAGG